MPRFAAERALLAPLDDVWAFVAEPYNLADWWPGVSGVEPDRRGLAPGARWQIVRSDAPTLLRRPHAAATLLVLGVTPKERLAFGFADDRVDAELTLAALDERRTRAALVVSGPWLVGLRRSLPRRALDRLHTLLRTGEEP